MARRRSRGFNRQLRRKFVWDRTAGTVTAGTGGPFGVDLLAGFRGQPGATHLGATVMRVRGYIRPIGLDTGAQTGGVVGFRIDSWNEDFATEVGLAPMAQPDEDWMAWLPFEGSTFELSNNHPATWNAQASPWAVDVKAARKLEELNQTLWMFVTPPTAGSIQYNYNLSVGLKLA